MYRSNTSNTAHFNFLKYFWGLIRLQWSDRSKQQEQNEDIKTKCLNPEIASCR